MTHTINHDRHLLRLSIICIQAVAEERVWSAFTGGFLWSGLKVVHVTPHLLLERCCLHSLLTTAVVSNVCCGREEQINERCSLLIYEILHSMCSDFSFSFAALGSSWLVGISAISSRWPLCQAVGLVAPVVGLSPHRSSQRRSPSFQPPLTSFMGLAGTPIFSYCLKHLYI